MSSRQYHWHFEVTRECFSLSAGSPGSQVWECSHSQRSSFDLSKLLSHFLPSARCRSWGVSSSCAKLKPTGSAAMKTKRQAKRRNRLVRFSAKGVLAIMSFSHHEVAACVTPSHKFSLLPLGYAIDLKQQICVVLPAQAVPTSRIEFCRQVAAWLTGDSEPRMLSARKPESETPTGRRTELRLKRARPEVRCVDVARVRELAAIRIRRKIGGRRGAPRNAQGKAHTG